MEYVNYEGVRDLSDDLYLSESRNNACPQHFHRNIELVYVRSGRMQARINGEECEYRSDEIVFVPSYYSHAFSTADESDVVILVIPFAYAGDFTGFFHGKTLPVKLDDPSWNRKVYPSFSMLLDAKGIASKLIFKGSIDIIMGLLLARYPLVAVSENRNRDLIVTVLDYIEKHCGEPVTLDGLADRFGYNKYHFSKLFNRYVGENLNNYVNIIRVQHVIRSYLDTPAENLTDTIFSCGFESTATFYRCFNHLYRCKPMAFFRKLKAEEVGRNHSPC